MDLKTERDFIGYGGQPPHAAWPSDARVAVQFVLNYEEGGERSVTDGDAHAETFLSEIIGANPYPARHMSCLLYTSPSPRDGLLSRMPSSA